MIDYFKCTLTTGLTHILCKLTCFLCVAGIGVIAVFNMLLLNQL